MSSAEALVYYARLHRPLPKLLWEDFVNGFVSAVITFHVHWAHNVLFARVSM